MQSFYEKLDEVLEKYADKPITMLIRAMATFIYETYGEPAKEEKVDENAG